MSAISQLVQAVTGKRDDLATITVIAKGLRGHLDEVRDGPGRLRGQLGKIKAQIRNFEGAQWLRPEEEAHLGTLRGEAAGLQREIEALELKGHDKYRAEALFKKAKRLQMRVESGFDKPETVFKALEQEGASQAKRKTALEKELLQYEANAAKEVQAIALRIQRLDSAYKHHEQQLQSARTAAAQAQSRASAAYAEAIASGSAQPTYDNDEFEVAQCERLASARQIEFDAVSEMLESTRKEQGAAFIAAEARIGELSAGVRALEEEIGQLEWDHAAGRMFVAAAHVIDHIPSGKLVIPVFRPERIPAGMLIGGQGEINEAIVTDAGRALKDGSIEAFIAELGEAGLSHLAP